MWFWWFMMVCNCLTPLLMIVLGRYLWKHYPKDINGIMGYRTKRSMQNAESWKFGNEYCGRLWYWIGILSLIPSAMILIPFVSSDADEIGKVSIFVIIIQMALLLGSIIPTEKALKKNFS